VHFFTLQIDDFCSAIADNRTPLATGEDGRETVRFIETLLKTGAPANVRGGGPARLH